MHLLLIVALFASIVAGPPPHRSPGNDLVADLVAETNACILEAFRDDGGFWAYLPCIELAQVVNDLRPPRESNYPAPDGIDAAMTTTYAAADLLSAVGSSDTSDWQQDVDTLLEMSDKYLAQYEALPDLDEDDVPASEPETAR